MGHQPIDEGFCGGIDGHLLHRIDSRAGLMTFVPTTRAALAAPAFIDGRTPFATGPEIAVSLDAMLATAVEGAASRAPQRYILHMGFCGSTLLARLLDRPGTVLTLREPAALTDIANWQADHDGQRGSDPRLAAALDFARSSLQRGWAPDEAVVIKSSNWDNNIARALAHDAQVVVVTIAPRDFITAIFRGGRDRMLFAARALVHLASAAPEFLPLFTRATEIENAPFDKVARIAALLHALQVRLLAQVRGATRIDFSQIRDAPEAAVRQACQALGLPAPAARDRVNRAAWLGHHAKAPGEHYSAEAHARADADVAARYGATIDAALDWAAAHLATVSRDERAA